MAVRSSIQERVPGCWFSTATFVRSGDGLWRQPGVEAASDVPAAMRAIRAIHLRRLWPWGRLQFMQVGRKTPNPCEAELHEAIGWRPHDW